MAPTLPPAAFGKLVVSIFPPGLRAEPKPINPRAFQRLSMDVSLSDDRRHDQSNGVNSVSATAGCSLFWTTVHGSVPTEALVVRSIIKAQSQMSMEDAFCMMTSFIKESSYGAGETSRNNQPPPLASFIPFYLHLTFSQQGDRVIISDGARFSLSNTVFSPCMRNNGMGFILAINEVTTLLERGSL